MSAYQQRTYTRFELSHTGIFEHARLAKQFNSSSWWHPVGSLAWGDPEGGCGAGHSQSFVEDVNRLQAWGYRVIWYDADQVNREWEPGIAFLHSQTPIALLPEEGWIDGPKLVSSLIKTAKASGGLTFWNSTFESIEVHGERVVALRLGNRERIKVDAVVNAAGPEAATVAATLGVPMLGGVSNRSSLVIDLANAGNPLGHVLRGSDIHIRPAGPGRVRVRSDQVDTCLTTGTWSDPGQEIIENLLERAYRTIPALASSTVEQTRIGTAVFPADGLPSVGALSAVSGYYEAFANSGITLAPFIGRILATQIVTGEIHPLFLKCSPDRLRIESKNSQDGNVSTTLF